MQHSKVVIATGGFDPIHSGHLKYLKAAKALGDVLIVGANSNDWLERKKGKFFMPLSERSQILESLVGVDAVIEFDDSDNSAKDAIRKVRDLYPAATIIFANGGDRTQTNIPEMDIQDNNLVFEFGVGGEDKANSSSWILQEWKEPRTDRPWGYYRVLHINGVEVKVKELTVEPGKMLSMQRHHYRNELWFVSEGIASVYTLDANENRKFRGSFGTHEQLNVSFRSWHQLCNETDRPLKIIEIQYGQMCVEYDIERQE